MNPEQRARHYADLFTACGDRWRMCVPVDGTPDRSRNRMHLQGVQIEKADDRKEWKVLDSSLPAGWRLIEPRRTIRVHYFAAGDEKSLCRQVSRAFGTYSPGAQQRCGLCVRAEAAS